MARIGVQSSGSRAEDSGLGTEVAFCGEPGADAGDHDSAIRLPGAQKYVK